MNIIINQLQKNFGPKVAVDIENYSIQSGDMLGLVGSHYCWEKSLSFTIKMLKQKCHLMDSSPMFAFFESEKISLLRLL